MFQVFMIDSVHGGGCLHDAASHGHVDCLKAILFAAHFTAFEDSRLVRLFFTHTQEEKKLTTTNMDASTYKQEW